MQATAETHVKIRNLKTRCDCGCDGSDPWHRETYTRNVNNIEATAETLDTVCGQQRVTRKGYARFPYGVVQVAFSPLYGWIRVRFGGGR